MGCRSGRLGVNIRNSDLTPCLLPEGRKIRKCPEFFEFFLQAVSHRLAKPAPARKPVSAERTDEQRREEKT